MNESTSSPPMSQVSQHGLFKQRKVPAESQLKLPQTDASNSPRWERIAIKSNSASVDPNGERLCKTRRPKETTVFHFANTDVQNREGGHVHGQRTSRHKAKLTKKQAPQSHGEST